MGRKPVLSLAGMFLAGVTMTGCECTDWCCGSKPKEPVATRPAPAWPTAQQQYPAPATTGYTRTTTPSDTSVAKPDANAQPVSDWRQNPVSGGVQGASANPVVHQEIVPPLPPLPNPDRLPAAVPAVPAVDNTPLNPLPMAPRTTTPRVEPDPQFDLPPSPPSAPLPPTDSPALPKLEGPSNADDPPPVPAPPTPVTPGKSGSSQSSSKYPQSIPELPPPAPGVPVMPGGN